MNNAAENIKAIIAGITAAASLMLAGSAIAIDMPQLANQYGCTNCHSIDKKVVGPAWADVSNKYKGAKYISKYGKEYSPEEYLINKVSIGGNGMWGSVPMPANDPSGTHKTDIRKLVNFILELSGKSMLSMSDK